MVKHKLDHLIKINKTVRHPIRQQLQHDTVFDVYKGD
jgi:hypothetical protein